MFQNSVGFMTSATWARDVMCFVPCIAVCRPSTPSSPSGADSALLPVRHSLFASVFRGGLRLWQGVFEGRHLALTHQWKWEACWFLRKNVCSTTSTSIKAICHSCSWRSTDLILHLFPVCGGHLLALGGSLQIHYHVFVLHTQIGGSVPLHASLDQVKNSLQV